MKNDIPSIADLERDVATAEDMLKKRHLQHMDAERDLALAKRLLEEAWERAGDARWELHLAREEAARCLARPLR